MDFAAACSSGVSLIWAQPQAMSRHYELSCGESLIGSLDFEKSCGSLAVAEVSPKRWTFKRVGFLAPRVTVRNANSEADLAIFRPQWGGGGTVEIRGSLQFQWRCANFWQTQWVFLRSDHQPVMNFSHRQGLLKASAKIAIDPAAPTDSEVPLLLALGWYLMILGADDAAAVAAATAAIA